MPNAWTWVVTAVVALAGCDQMAKFGMREPAPPPAAPAPSVVPEGVQSEFLAHSAVKTDTGPSAPGAVDVALEWSRKYAESAEQLLAEQRANRDLRDQNRKLSDDAVKQQAQFAQSQKELAEANETLMQLGKELAQWRENVMGYRGEMLQLQKTQMEALKKVLLLLGAEIGPSGATPAGKAVGAAGRGGAGAEEHATARNDG
jgi:hypothetical protein